jgi:hypothetical protein
MPKRTNEFQKLIALIYQKITPLGGKVTESGMVYDKDAKILREVDILIEHQYAGHDIKIMVECRDRTRKDTVEWIDGLIGKSKSLDVNKIVAVSRKGFAKPTLEKARANGVDVLTLEEARDADWQNYPIKPMVTVHTDEVYSLKEVAYFKDGNYYPLSQVGLNTVVLYNGEIVGTIKEVFEYIFQNTLIPQIDEYLKDRRKEIFISREDLNKPLYVEIEKTIPLVTIVNRENEQIDFSKVKFFIQGSRTVFDLKQSHMKFNKTVISLGEHLNPDGSKLKFKVIQESETKKIHVQWNKE